MEAFETWVMVWDVNGDTVILKAEDEALLDIAVEHHMATGEDTKMVLTTLEGARFCMRASQVQSWMVSTPEVRKRGMARELAIEEEQEAFRVALGLEEEEEKPEWL